MNTSPFSLVAGDKEMAIQAIREHLEAGRLTRHEAEERITQVYQAQTRYDLAMVFMDLPEPHAGFDVRSVVGFTAVGGEHTIVDGILRIGSLPRPKDILDNQVFAPFLTVRKLRRIGWVTAVMWMVATLSADLPAAVNTIAPVVAFTPMWLMSMVNVWLKPTTPRWRTIKPKPLPPA